eukprot:TRINITY_DN3992_c0_g1_i6.p1 TRINITY_DN3992_c0_g1~~TRINITY_DN3992_c0_g1_i6.p1  ORF type:complete len:340 (-),score=43.75 TRINITY_DN3992_c0_g1_i6:299-1318(-)
MLLQLDTAREQHMAKLAMFAGANKESPKTLETTASLRKRWISFCRRLTHEAGVMKGGLLAEGVVHKWWTRLLEMRDVNTTGRFGSSLVDQVRLLQVFDSSSLSHIATVELGLWFVWFTQQTVGQECLVKDKMGNEHAVLIQQSEITDLDPNQTAQQNVALLELFVADLDDAIKRDLTPETSECAVESVFEDGHGCGPKNMARVKKYIQAAADPYSAVRSPDSDLALFLDLLSSPYALSTTEYQEYVQRLEWEAVPGLPLENQESRQQAFFKARHDFLERVHSQDSIFFTREMQDQYEQQARLNVHAEISVLKFKTWSAEHLNQLCHTPLVANSPLPLRL